MKPYVLFGAGANAANGVRIIGKDKIAFIVDNDKKRQAQIYPESRYTFFQRNKRNVMLIKL